jgi:hypothetical protein
VFRDGGTDPSPKPEHVLNVRDFLVIPEGITSNKTFTVNSLAKSLGKAGVDLSPERDDERYTLKVGDFVSIPTGMLSDKPFTVKSLAKSLGWMTAGKGESGSRSTS